MATPVIFRKFDDGEIMAVFPNTREGQNGLDFLSYMSKGQHAPASMGSIEITRSATPEEYTPLLKELVSIGYDDLVSMNGKSLNV